MEKLLLRIPEVVEITGFSRSEIYRHIGNGDLPTVHLGRAVRVRAEDVRAWVNRLSEAAR